jgi:hypothetical protein
MRDCRGGAVEPEDHAEAVGRVLRLKHRAAQFRHVAAGIDRLPVRTLRDAQWTHQPLEGFRHRAVMLRGHLHQHALLAGEVLKIEPQDLEERRPAISVPFELRIPVVAVGEPAMNHPHRAGSARLGLHDPFGCDRARPLGRLGDKAVRRLPFGDRGDRVHAVARPEMADRLAADAPVHLRRHEPGRYSRPRRDRLPYCLGRSRHLDFGLHGAPPRWVLLDWHDQSFPTTGVGWARTTSRCGRPPGAAAS